MRKETPGTGAAFAVAALATGLAACGGSQHSITGPSENVIGSGRVVTESRSVQGFNAVSLSGVGRLTIEHTGVESLSITAEDNILPLLTSEVRGGVLFLGPRGGTSISQSRDIEYRLTVRELDEMALSGVTEAFAPELDTDLLRIAISGVSSITAGGRADRQGIAISGASRYDAERLVSRSARLNVSGVSTAVVRVSDLLEGEVSGASVVEYFGSPVLRVNVSGGATVRSVGS